MQRNTSQARLKLMLVHFINQNIML